VPATGAGGVKISGVTPILDGRRDAASRAERPRLLRHGTGGGGGGGGSDVAAGAGLVAKISVALFRFTVSVFILSLSLSLSFSLSIYHSLYLCVTVDVDQLMKFITRNARLRPPPTPIGLWTNRETR